MSEIDLELAAFTTAKARALEAHKRIRRSYVAFVVGAVLQLLPIAANATGTRPPLLEIPFLMLFGGYLIWSAYLVFTPMWRKVWSEERPKIGCNPVTLVGASVAFVAVFCVAFLVGPFGGGIWSYLKLRKASIL